MALDRYDAGVLLGSAGVLCFNLYSVTGTPHLLGGDEQVFWLNAQRLMQGELIYRDFFEFTPPGTDLFYLSAFALLGTRIWVTNLVVLLLGMLLSWLCFHIARRLTPPVPALLASALFMVLGYCYWLDATHHWFSLLAVVAAVAALSPADTRPRILLAGALLGLASFFTQTRGLSAALGCSGFLILRRFEQNGSWAHCLRHTLALWVAFGITWLALSSYFIAKVGLSSVLYFQTSYVLRYVVTESDGVHRNVDNVLTWPPRFMLTYGAIAAVYGISAWKCRPLAKTSLADRRQAVLLLLVGAALFLEVAQNPSWPRVDYVAMPAVILFVWLMTDITLRWRRCVTVGLWLAMLALAGHRIWYRQVQHSVIEDLPGGRAAVIPIMAEKLEWLERRTQPGQLFFQAGYQSLYLPLALRMPAYSFINRQVRPDFVDLDMRQLEARRVQYIFWSPLDLPRFPQFERFLAARYQRTHTFSDHEEAWELRP